MSNGLHQLSNQFRRMADNARSLEGTQSVPIEELMPAPFVQRHSRFSSIQEMIDAAGIAGQEEFEGQAWNDFVAQNTTFANWEGMVQQAGGEWVSRKIGF